jgi:hypothetical protein
VPGWVRLSGRTLPLFLAGIFGLFGWRQHGVESVKIANVHAGTAVLFAALRQIEIGQDEGMHACLASGRRIGAHQKHGQNGQGYDALGHPMSGGSFLMHNPLVPFFGSLAPVMTLLVTPHHPNFDHRARLFRAQPVRKLNLS